MLKADLHLHCKGDIEDTYIAYTAKNFIDHAASLGFDLLSFTTHRSVFNIRPFQRYARKKGILLIPGTEAFIQDKDVLLYNFSQAQVKKIETFEDLRSIKKKHHLVLAPHPFYPHIEPPNLKNRALNRVLIDNIDLFDGLEFCNLYTRYFTFNKKAVRVAKQYRLALVGNSDAHRPLDMNTTFSLVDAEPSVDCVINAIKQGKVEVVSVPRSTYGVLELVFMHARHILPKTL